MAGGLIFAGNLYIPLQSPHPAWLNIFFINYTFMGDGVFVLALSLFYLLYLKEKQMALLVFAGFVLSLSLVQFLKNQFNLSHFNLFFEQGQHLFFSDENSLADYHPFPSGHTATAFMIATVVAIKAKNMKWQLILLPAAILLAISRMYLAQDSVTDIVAGAFLGCISPIVIFCCLVMQKKLKANFKWYFFGTGNRNRTTVVESV